MGHNNLATAGVLDVYTFTTTALEISTPKNSNAVVSAAKLANHVTVQGGNPADPKGWRGTTPATAPLV